MTDRTRIHIELAAGEAIQIGDATITLIEKSGRRARLTVQASACTAVTRQPATTTPSALECASSALMAKEHTHGQYPI